MAITKTYKREDVYSLLLDIDAIARKCDRRMEFGLPRYSPEVMGEICDLVITKLGLTIMEDERILTIQKHTGCTRAQAQSLIDSGDI